MFYNIKLKTGFTLVEMLVVIAIIAIIAALLLPALSKAKENSYRAQCVNNFKQFSIGIQMYADDHGEQLPGPVWLGSYEEYDNVDYKRLTYYIASYLGLPPAQATPQFSPVSRCPSAARHWTPADASTPLMSKYVPLSYMAGRDITNLSSGAAGTVSRPFGYPYSLPPFSRGTNEGPKRLHEIFTPALSWALTDVDQENGIQAAEYYDFLPVTPVHGTVRNQLFFDWHIAAVPAATNL